MQTTRPGSSSIQKMRGVGPQLAKKLARLDLHSPEDLLLHFPYRYQDRTKVQPVRTLRPGDQAVIEGVIQSINTPPHGKTKLLCELHDGSSKVWLRFFHVFQSQSNQLQVGARVRCYQQVRLGPKGLEMVHPEYKVVQDGKIEENDKYLTAFYPATEGLSQHMLRKLTDQAMDWMQVALLPAELFPKTLLDTFSFPTIQEAIRFVHRPEQGVSIEDLNENKTIAQKRLVFEELVSHRLSLLRMKRRFQSQRGVPVVASEQLVATFRQQLSFELTSAQNRVVDEIAKDLVGEAPMLRLVQGDVGSGKTVVAAIAMLQVVESGYQAALMAPTELLAEQHERNFRAWFESMGLKVVFLTGSAKAAERRKALEEIESGHAQIVIGTHALFQDKVNFANLALIVVDEQHRFGVQQRAMFRKKGQQQELYPHQLIMTATPIPRTLAMSFYADIDCSSIDELPPGRTPVVTSVLAASKRDEVMQKIKAACREGKQVYWVCPLIEESEAINAQAATVTFETLTQVLANQVKVGLVHGRMKADEKNNVMQAFKNGEIELLVATTVIEVGVDVPNASLMVIENAERLGLSQLHQLRGRVGRGDVASYCLLLYDAPLSNLAKERLSVMRSTNDGFKIAQRDLELRGPGEILGTRQTGEMSFRFADLMRDGDLLGKVNQAADIIMQDHSNIIDILIRRWLGHRIDHANV